MSYHRVLEGSFFCLGVSINLVPITNIIKYEIEYSGAVLQKNHAWFVTVTKKAAWYMTCVG